MTPQEPLSIKTCKRGHGYDGSLDECPTCAEKRKRKNAKLQKNTCIDCGAPTSGVRCQLHANLANGEKRRISVINGWKEFNAKGRIGKRGTIGRRYSEEAKILAKQRAIERGLPAAFIEWRDKPKYGPDNPSWKGGRTIDTEGYVEIRINGKYVREHRHIMEQMIERPLISTEQVHHRDGNRQNNAPENLELRTGNHGIGATKHCPTCTCCAGSNDVK